MLVPFTTERMTFMRSVVGALRARPSLVLGVELADAAARQP
jgi:hypothetical protein